MTFILGSRNLHKLHEMRGLLADIDLVELPEGIPEPAENGDSFAANAKIKSEAYAKATGQWVIADDSGICVKALEGAPGIYSARFAGEGASDEDNNQLLLKKLKGADDRSAYYVCVLSLASPEGEVFSVEGRCHGHIQDERAGDQGFGYDPYFFSDDLNQPFGNADPDDKAKVSHRAKAAILFVEELQKRELAK